MAQDTNTHTLYPGEDPIRLIEREWLITNGRGGYAMGTALGCPARRYHGLLVAAAQPPVGRLIALNQVFEQLELQPADGAGPMQRLELNTCQFRDANGESLFAPRGHEHLACFERGLSVSWHYQWGRLQCSRTLTLPFKEQAATLRYQVSGLKAVKSTARLRLAPMVSLRDFHALLHHGHAEPFEIEGGGERVTLHRGGAAATFACAGATFSASPDWWYGLYYPRETERGQGDQEDLFVPGAFEVPVSDETELTLTVALGTAAAPVADDAQRDAHLQPTRTRVDQRVIAGIQPTQSKKPVVEKESLPALAESFTIAADDFVVERSLKGQSLSTIIAGYPWFADWGRDTFIALPGLLLTTGRFDEARDVLRVFAEAVDGGLVPNRFDDYTEAAAHYNTVDASLWFVQAAMQYVEVTGDEKSWRDWLAEACMDVVDAYADGTGGPDPAMDPLIAMREDGLIAAGNARTQLTWMDAACGEVVFTPRPGKAVEINALWYNALAGLAEHLSKRDEAASKRYRTLADRVKRHFASVFWSASAGYLFDHVATDEAGEPMPDPSLRPNQVFACALPRSPLGKAKQKQVVKLVREHLLTPAGLRTLPADDANYHPHYGGDQFQRDEAYHQGTIWPWLIGPYCEAALRVGDFSASAQRHVRETIAPLVNSLVNGEAVASLRAGSIGQIAEIYQAEPDAAGQFLPVGCIAQAWSVAELLRIGHLLAGEDAPTRAARA